MPRHIRILSIFFFATFHGLACVANGQEKIDFGRQVRPIISDRCFHCHGPDANNQDSSFRMDSEEALMDAIVPGDTAASEFFNRIHSDDPDTMMPPPDSNRSLSNNEKRILDLWIEQGASYEGHWAFELPTKPQVPSFSSNATKANWPADSIEAWSQNPIDAFIAQRLIENNLKPSPPADLATLIRRAALTTTGLLPPDSLQQMEDASKQDALFSKAVDALLDSNAYAERQTLRWLDAARYADTDGYQNDLERQNWPWRDWVIKAFRDNMPFDQFVIEQLAGDMLPNATESQKLASAFNRNHRQNAEGGALADEFQVENVIDRVETTSTVFLGLTFGCSRCHDHKYDPLSQKEFYQLYGYFNNIGEKGIGRGINANPTMKTTSPLLDIDPKWRADLEQSEKALNKYKPELEKRLKAWTTASEDLIKRIDAADKDKKTSAATDDTTEENRAAKTTEKIEVADRAEVSQQDRKAFDALGKEIQKLLRLPKRNKGQNDKLRAHFVKTDAKQKELQAAVNQAKKEFGERGGVFASVMVMKERPGKAAPAYLLQRGQYDAPDKSESLTRGAPAVLLADGIEQPGDRLELAKWIVSKDNPLTARVIINRIWRDHFGTGLVKTTGDFGVQGEAPSHPELLDWLATEFIQSGWDVKAMHRLILTSQTYQQSSKTNERLQTIDPENRLLARGPRYRADGFTIRDNALLAANLLNEKAGGPSVKPYQPEGLWAVVAANKGTRYTPDKGESLYRKSMYSYWKRAVNPPRQTIFDAGGREICSVQVRRTNTPLQALVLMNDKTFIEAARSLAESVMKMKLDSDEARLSEMYRRAIARKVSPESLDVLKSSLGYFREHFLANEAEAKKLLAIGETKRDSTLYTPEHAAMTAVAHVILNLDEFLTVE